MLPPSGLKSSAIDLSSNFVLARLRSIYVFKVLDISQSCCISFISLTPYSIVNLIALVGFLMSWMTMFKKTFLVLSFLSKSCT